MKNVKKKKKRKNGFKKFIRTVVFTMVLCAGGVGALLYNRMFFKGEVKDKYQSDEPKSNRILVKTWFGEKDFCVDDETYVNVNVGARYSFRKEKSFTRRTDRMTGCTGDFSFCFLFNKQECNL